MSETESDTDESEIESTDDRDEQPGLTDHHGPDEGDESGGLDALKERRTWSFDIEAPDGSLVSFAGEDPADDDSVAQLTSPTADASLLYWRAVDLLQTDPDVSREEWDDLNPKFKGIIASRHFDEFGLDEFLSDREIENLMGDLKEQANGGE